MIIDWKVDTGSDYNVCDFRGINRQLDGPDSPIVNSKWYGSFEYSEDEMLKL